VPIEKRPKPEFTSVIKVDRKQTGESPVPTTPGEKKISEVSTTETTTEEIPLTTTVENGVIKTIHKITKKVETRQTKDTLDDSMDRRGSGGQTLMIGNQTENQSNGSGAYGGTPQKPKVSVEFPYSSSSSTTTTLEKRKPIFGTSTMDQKIPGDGRPFGTHPDSGQIPFGTRPFGDKGKDPVNPDNVKKPYGQPTGSGQKPFGEPFGDKYKDQGPPRPDSMDGDPFAKLQKLGGGGHKKVPDPNDGWPKPTGSTGVDGRPNQGRKPVDEKPVSLTRTPHGGDNRGGVRVDLSVSSGEYLGEPGKSWGRPDEPGKPWGRPDEPGKLWGQTTSPDHLTDHESSSRRITKGSDITRKFPGENLMFII